MALHEAYVDRISDDWIWRDAELRQVSQVILRSKASDLELQAAVLVTYAHWEGHFKFSATQILLYMHEAIKRKVFAWTDIDPGVRHRLLFCSYRKASVGGQSFASFVEHLDSISQKRFNNILGAADEIIMVDDNLNYVRAEATCRNLGVSSSWFALKKVVIDNRLLETRNALAHGSRRLRSGDLVDLRDELLLDAIRDVIGIIRQSRTEFQNAIFTRCFLNQPTH